MNKVSRILLCLPLLLLAACGNEPPCADAGVVKTVKELTIRSFLRIPTWNSSPINLDVTPTMDLQSIVVRNWNADIKAAECSGRFTVDERRLWTMIKESDDPNDKTGAKQDAQHIKIENIGPPIKNLVFYSVKRTADGEWWIEIQDIRHQ